MHRNKAVWLGSLVLALATTLTWAQGPQGPKGNAFAPAQKQPAHVAPVLDTDPDRRQAGADTPHLGDDYRHHSLDDDADRAHQRRQHRPHQQAAAANENESHAPATTLADAH